jgi:putative FmdB family regulatory protein
VPTYEYRCPKGHQFEVTQRMSDPPVEACERCGAPVERVFHPVAVHFKGSGFYTTDYAGKSKVPAGAGKDGDSGDSGGDSGGSGGDSASSGSDPSSSKPDSGSKSESKPGSGGGGDKAKASGKKD